MNLRDIFTQYKSIITESINTNTNNATVDSFESDGLMIANSIEHDDSTLIDRMCFMLYVIFGKADEYQTKDWLKQEYEQELEDGNDVNEEDYQLKPGDVELSTWAFNSFYGLVPKRPGNTSTDYIRIGKFSFSISAINYHPAFPTRCYITGTFSCPGCTYCNINEVGKNTANAHCEPPVKYPYKNEYGSMDRTRPWPQELLDLTYPENLPMEDKMFLYNSVLRHVETRLTGNCPFGTSPYFDDNDPHRKTEFIEYALMNYPDKKICTWGKYKLLKKVLD